MTRKMTANSVATMIVLGCLATPALAGEPAANTTNVIYDNQFEVYSAADLETWWQHYAPVVAAQKAGTPSDAAPSASAEGDKVARLQAPDRSYQEWTLIMAELKEQRTMLVEQGREISKLQSMLQSAATTASVDAE